MTSEQDERNANRGAMNEARRGDSSAFNSDEEEFVSPYDDLVARLATEHMSPPQIAEAMEQQDAADAADTLEDLPETEAAEVLGDGELTKKLTVQAHRFSESAKKKIEAAGGKCEVIEAKAAAVAEPKAKPKAEPKARPAAKADAKPEAKAAKPKKADAKAADAAAKEDKPAPKAKPKKKE
jgi:hypothetical protein